ncbi:thymidylate kinase [Pseudoscourfieldia marina]
MAPPPSTIRRGAFIVLEGVDRSGKSTQCTRLLSKLLSSASASASASRSDPSSSSSAINVGSSPSPSSAPAPPLAVLWRFPDRTTTIGRLIDSYLKSSVECDDAAIHLLFSANRHEKSRELLALLEQGTTVIADRYAYSGVAFTAAKQVPGLDLAWCKQPDVGLPEPDLTVFLNLDPQEAAKRGGYGEERYENLEMQARVAANFMKLQDNTWTVLDAAMGDVDAVSDAIYATVTPVVEACAAGTAGPIKQLWLPDKK